MSALEGSKVQEHLEDDAKPELAKAWPDPLAGFREARAGLEKERDALLARRKKNEEARVLDRKTLDKRLEEIRVALGGDRAPRKRKAKAVTT